MEPRLDEYIDFPTIFTFKIVGDNTSTFTFGVEALFCDYAEKSIVPTQSGSGKYISLSVTVHVQSYDELKGLYGGISKLQGLKFHV